MGSNGAYNEAELLSLLSQGDVKSFDAIYNMYSEGLFRYALSRLGSEEDSEDLIQSIFISLWEKREEAHHIKALRYYLYCSVRYKIITQRKRTKEKGQQNATYISLTDQYDNSNQELQDLRDTEMVIERSISTLPERVQMAFRLSRMEHLPISDVAKRMNISPHSVENYIAQALKQLRSSVGEAMLLAIWLNS